MWKIYFWLIFLGMCIIIAGCASTHEKKLTEQFKESYKTQITKTIGCQYLISLPKGYEDNKKRWPLILFLHGSGEQGDDINLVKMHGPPMLIDKGKEFPFIVVSPQCPADLDYWSNDVLIHLLDKVESQYRVDTTRVYLTGLSLGGEGTWSLAIAYPERFAAIAPVCGDGNPLRISRLKNVPVWAFHGAKDKVVPLSEEEEMVDALKACGGDVKFTVYPDLGHNAWTVTYNNEELYQWFLSHKKNN